MEKLEDSLFQPSTISNNNQNSHIVSVKTKNKTKSKRLHSSSRKGRKKIRNDSPEDLNLLENVMKVEADATALKQ